MLQGKGMIRKSKWKMKKQITKVICFKNEWNRWVTIHIS